MMVLLALHLARHRLREPQLLEAIAHFLVVQEAQLNSKVGLPLTFLSHLVRRTPLSSLIGCCILQETAQLGSSWHSIFAVPFLACPPLQHMPDFLQFSKHS